MSLLSIVSNAYLTHIESVLLMWTNWPDWSLRTIVALVIMIVIVAIADVLLTSRKEEQGRDDENVMEGSSSTSSSSSSSILSFRAFQLQYLSVFFVIMLADWLQGTNMYTLYLSYGVNVGNLFLTGFLSSALFGTFLGIFVDSWGRKLGCIVFCLLEIVINTMEHIPNMNVLLLGRILGGLSTSLLFSAFEAWMVSEHRKRHFPESWLSSTFAICSWGNGMTAIVAGFIAQVASDKHGDIGPFKVAIALTVITLVMILPWNENFGNQESSSDTKKDANGVDSNDKDNSAELGLFSSCSRALTSSWQVIQSDRRVLFLGLSQAAFEGAVYSFVFMWVPSLLALMPAGSSLPTGLVFSCFMLAMTLGGMLFTFLLPIVPGDVEVLCVVVFATSAIAMAIPMFCFQFWPVFICFLVLEAMLGMFNSCGATMRSKVYPDHLQSSIISLFRLPLNVLVVIGTKLTDNANSAETLQWTFGYLFALHVIAMILQLCLVSHSVPQTICDYSNVNLTSSIEDSEQFAKVSIAQETTKSIDLPENVSTTLRRSSRKKTPTKKID